MSKEFPTIIIPCQDNPGMETIEISFSRTDLHAPKNSWRRPYSNPKGEDNKSLQCHVRKKKGGDILQDAYNLSFDFERDEAIFSFDPNKIQVREDKGLFEFELMGKYGFKEYVRIRWEKEKCSLINIVPHIGRTSYTLGKNDTSIGNIEVSPKKMPCQPEIKVKISLDEALRNYLNIVDDFILQNGEAKKINISLKKESIKHLPTQLISGKIILRVDSSDGNVESVEVAIGKASLLDGSECENCVTLIEESHLSIANSNDDDELFDEDNPLTVYVNQEPKQKDIELNTTLTEATARIKVVPNRRGGKTLVSSEDFGKEIQLKDNHPEIVSISISPNEKAETTCQSLILSADYSLPCEKKVYVKTIEQEPPTGYLHFDFSSLDEDNNPNPYYKGNGKEKIGTLKVVNESLNNEQYRQVLLPPTCTCPFVTIDPLEKSVKAVKANETASYNVFIDIPESEAVETDEDNNLQLDFSCDSLKKITESLPIQSKEPEPIQIKFAPESNIVFSPDEKILAGYLYVQYTRKDSRCYINRNERLLTLEDSGIILIANKKNGSKLAIEDGDYPVYYDCAVKYAGKKNIDEKEHVKLVLSYSDSIENEREIPIEFDIQPINAIPQPNVLIRNRNNSMIWEDGIIKAKWIYQFDSRARNVAQSVIIGTISFVNKQTVPYKDSKLLFKNIVLEGEHLRVHHDSEFSIPNGSESKDFSIQILYGEIPVADNISTELRIKYDICLNNDIIPMEDTIPITIIEKVTDDWYSLDLGTTGIVVAKWNADNSDETIPIELRDEDDPIEKETTIVSSKTILKDYSEDGFAECVVRPNILELKQKATFVLVPSKFLVGQVRIPFSRSYKQRYKNGIRINQKNISWDEIEPKLVLQHTYEKIFDMVDNDCKERIRKLIVTYPNTYTPSALSWLRNSIIPSEEGAPTSRLFPILTHNNLHFIPESDAVVAFYVNQEINKITSMKDNEDIIIYDMGAGTLDLSYVHIENQKKGGKTKRNATILKRIGIPIAGEFFSYLLYKQLEDKFAKSSMTTIKEWVDLLKNKFDTSKTYKDLNFTTSVFSDSNTNNENMEIGVELENWISICSSEIFVQLLGTEWQSKVDKIVFSGRGSQFVPLRKKIEEQIGEEKIDDKSIPTNCLKQCVAKGALLYQRIFENANMPFELVHKNTYLNLGIFHRVLSPSLQREWQYDEIVGEKDYIWDKRPINGAYHAMVNAKKVPLNLSEDADVIFYLTILSEDEMRQLVKNQNDCKWCFVNELFRFNPGFLDAEDSVDREKIVMTISIDENNQLSIVLGDDGEIDLLKHTASPNIEDNRFFSLCNDYLNKK